jgi:hypothetical protein
MDSGASYRLTVRTFADRAGNLIDTLHASADFTGSVTPDTVKPHLTLSVKDSARGISPALPLRITFSEPVDSIPLHRAVTLSDTGKRPVDSELRWLTPVELTLHPRADLQFNSWYRLQVVLDSVRDLEGNAIGDSTLVVRYLTVDLRTTGTVEGSVTDARKERGRIVVTAVSADAGEARKKSAVLPEPGPFLLERLSEGMYGLNAFRDADSSGAYSYGLPFPFKPSERFTVYQDTVKVRARWGVQGVVIPLK